MTSRPEVGLRFDVVIVGGGPAGLSAALMLGRCRRRIAVCDDGRPRNGTSSASHGFFTRDGQDPRDLLRIARAQLGVYDVTFFDERAVGARREREQFAVTLSSGVHLVGRCLLLATGIVDDVPDVAGIEQLFGTSVFPCPFCDGWEFRDQPLAAYAQLEDAAEFAVGLSIWSRDLVLCTDGAHNLDPASELRLRRNGIAVRTERIARLDGRDGRLEHVVFESGERLARRAMFFDTATVPRSDLARELGCELTEGGMVKTGASECTTVPGLYVAGDASCDLNLVAIAVAEGAKAGCAIHKALRVADLP